MIKTILVPTSGSEADQSVLATALAIGQSLKAHLSCFHVNLTPTAAAAHSHLEFCQGPELADALEGLSQHERARSDRARTHFEAFCTSNGIRIHTSPSVGEGLSASWTEQTDQAEERLLFKARHHDLVVLGRRHDTDHLASGLIESLLIQSGRPLVIAPPKSPRTISGTVVVGWKETAEAARAVAFALPLLQHASSVILLAVSERGSASEEALDECARQLAWHGIVAEVELMRGISRPTATELTEAAVRRHAELLVVGGFGHGQLREYVFGGVTRALIDSAVLPVFIAH